MDPSEVLTVSLSKKPYKRAVLRPGPSIAVTPGGPPLACVEKALSNSLLDFSYTLHPLLCSQETP